MKQEQKKISISDLMTAEQATKIIEYCESLEKRIENLENEVKALRANQLWGPVYEIVRIYSEKEEH